MDPVVAFALGGGVALAFQKRLKKVGRSVLVGAVRAKRSVARVVADVREGLEDIEAEVEQRESARPESKPTTDLT